METSNSNASLTPFGARRLCGLKSRPILYNPEATFKEIATQVVTFASAFKVNADTKKQWTWPPRYIGMPKPSWKADFREENKTTKIVRRIRKK